MDAIFTKLVSDPSPFPVGARKPSTKAAAASAGRMSSNSLALTTSRFGRFHNDQETFSGGQYRRAMGRFGASYHLYHQPQEDVTPYLPWRSFEERLRSGPDGLTRFPLQPHSPVRVLLLDAGADEEVSPRLRQFIRDSSPRIRQEWQLGAQLEPDPGLSIDEFRTAMKTLRKQVYMTPYRRRKSFPRGLFGNRTGSAFGAGEENDTEKEDGKDCAICLETFVPNEQVLVTPCNHMFHNDCLIPWVKSQGKCPVCRRVFYEKRDNNAVNYNMYGNNNNTGSRRGDVSTGDVVLLMRAMEEAFTWVNSSRPGSY